jgi:effector-binding domain-containing protein
MALECKLLEKSARPALVIRTRAPVFRLAKVFGEAYAALEKYLAELKEQPAEAPFTGYFNMNMFSLDMAIGFPVHRALPGNGKIVPFELPGGKAASCLYVGPYNKVSSAYKELDQWIRANGYKATGICYEFYLNDPTVTPQAELQTRIEFPLK